MLDLFALSSAEISRDEVDRRERRFALDAKFSASGANLFTAKMPGVSHEGCLHRCPRRLLPPCLLISDYRSGHDRAPP